MKCKRILSVLLAVVLLLGSFPMVLTAGAADAITFDCWNDLAVNNKYTVSTATSGSTTGPYFVRHNSYDGTYILCATEKLASGTPTTAGWNGKQAGANVNPIGAWIELTLDNIPAGTYQISFDAREIYYNGKISVATNVGTANEWKSYDAATGQGELYDTCNVDEHANQSVRTTFNVSTPVTFVEGTNTMRFTVEAYGAGSTTQARMDLYSITLTPYVNENAILSAPSFEKTVAEGIALTDILPSTVTVNVGNSGATADLPVSWSNYDPTYIGTQDLTGTLDLTGTEYDNSENVTAKATITTLPYIDENGKAVIRPSYFKRTTGGTTLLAGDTTKIGTGDGANYKYWYGTAEGDIHVYIPAGTYDITYGYKDRKDVLVQFRVNGDDLGEPVQNYVQTTPTHLTAECGTYTFEEDGTAVFTLAAVGGTSNEFTVDNITLVPTIPEGIEMNVTNSDAAVVANGDKYDITWNANVVLGENATLDEINDKVTFKEYGVIYGTTEENVLALANGDETVTGAKIKAFETGENIDVYTIFGFRLKGVVAERERAAMFYVTYEYNGQTYTVYSDAVSATAVVAE